MNMGAYGGTPEASMSTLSVGSIGDLNNDSVDDLVIGAPEDDDGGSNQGKVYVYYGNPTHSATPTVGGLKKVFFAKISIETASLISLTLLYFQRIGCGKEYQPISMWTAM